MTSHSSSQAVLTRIERIETALRQTKKGTRSLVECMSRHRIAGASIAVINEYEIEWARGYGVREMGGVDSVDVETRFQACSISKPVTAVAALRLVEQGLLDLDRDVNTFLTSWKLPADRTLQQQPTLRQLLSHTAGISVPWFAGYHPEQDIPTLREILDSEQPSNNFAVRITELPGVRFHYSGGGYCILQQLLVDIMKKPFPQIMQELVFNPLSMQHSTYEPPHSNVEARCIAPMSPQQENVAIGHRSSGKPMAGKWHIFPEMAAAGLWTTASDLARFALGLQKAKANQSGQILSPHMVEEMLTPQSKGDERGDMGLGIFVKGRGRTARIGHPGDNPGFACSWLSLIHEGRGCVVMTNSDNGWALQNDLASTIAQVYAWPPVASYDKPLN